MVNFILSRVNFTHVFKCPLSEINVIRSWYKGDAVLPFLGAGIGVGEGWCGILAGGGGGVGDCSGGTGGLVGSAAGHLVGEWGVVGGWAEQQLHGGRLEQEQGPGSSRESAHSDEDRRIHHRSHHCGQSDIGAGVDDRAVAGTLAVAGTEAEEHAVAGQLGLQASDHH